MTAIYEEREQLRADLLAGKIPRRAPMTIKFQIEAACQCAGVDLRRALYDPELMEKACASICENFYSDTFPIRGMRFPWSFQIAKAQNWAVSSSGSIQRPEVQNMKPEWYDEFIADPISVIMEKILPNVCKALDAEPVRRGIVFAQIFHTRKEEDRLIKEITRKLTKAHDYMAPLMTGPSVPIPFDNLADKFRGFRGIMIDMRRTPEKVAAAVNALLPVAKYLATRQGTKPGTVSYIPLHMPPYISTEAFEKFYWPTFEEMIVFMDGRGVLTNLFAEGDWSRYYGHLCRLPRSTSVQFEEGDPVKIKSTFGKEHVFGGLYDPTITLARTKEECVDEAKRLFDVCGEGGKFYFSFNRNVMDLNSVDVPKLRAVLEWVRTKAVY